MKISRENYELWFTDWLDNNLSGRQTDELYAFLDLNRDLKDEFNALSSIRLTPEEIIYTGKDKLLRSPEQISTEQFELLCASWLENDLSAVQEMELEQMISSDDEKRKTAGIYKRMKLRPSGDVFAGKNRLLRKTPGQVIFRMAVIGLSAAAMVALIITTGIFRQPDAPSVPETRIASTENIVPSPGVASPLTPGNNTGNLTDSLSAVNRVSPPQNQAEKPGEHPPVSEPEIIINREEAPEKIAFNVKSSLAENTTGNSLVASNATFNQQSGQPAGDNRSNIGRFLAHTFRSKILDESSDEPLKGYEIAEAGISGINKLLGWEMALSRNNDENGEVKSVYFSSRMLKFNAPVKNNDVAE